VLIFIDALILIYSRMYLVTTVRQGGEGEFKTVPPPDNQCVGGNYQYDFPVPPMRDK